MSAFKSWRVQIYFLREMFPSFVLGLLLFVFVLLLFQALRLTEFILVQGVDLPTVGKIVLYLIQSFLPAILPMSCLFAVIFTYSRFSTDSEWIALKAIGFPTAWLALPAVGFGLFVSALTFYSIMYAGPAGNREFEIIIRSLAQQKSYTRIQEGTFSESFNGLVLYTQKYQPQRGLLEKVFVYDESQPNRPVSIVAQRGQILQSKKPDSVQSVLRLIDGKIHQPVGDTHTGIRFQTYDIFTNTELGLQNTNLSAPSLSLTELNSERAKAIAPLAATADSAAQLNHQRILKRKRALETEYHKRWAISILPLIFAALGMGQAIPLQRRSGGSNSFVVSMAIIIAFWISYISGENWAKEGRLPILPAVWFTNLAFVSYAFYRLRKIWH